MKQLTREVKGIKKNVCAICNIEINYPEGVYFRNGIEIHNKCLAVARMRRGSVKNIDR